MSWCNVATPQNLQPGYLNRVFVGREKDIENIRSILIDEKEAVLILQGSPGVGKTALAQRFARDFEDHFPGGVQFITSWSNNYRQDRSLADHFMSMIDVREDLQSLLVLDEIDGLPQTAQWFNTFSVLASLLYPKLTILATSRPNIIALPFRKILLNPLSTGDIERLIQEEASIYGNIPIELRTLAAGNPLIASIIAEILRQNEGKFDAVISRLQSFERTGLVDCQGHPISKLSKPGRILTADARTTDKALLQKIAEQPDLVYSISPRRFEEIAAELFQQLGYTVDLTPASKDGGRDLHVARKDDLGTLMFYVECKRYAPDRPVGVGLVRALYGVVEAGKATAGLLLTTSHFTKGARDFQCKLEHRLTLSDYAVFRGWLQQLKY